MNTTGDSIMNSSDKGKGLEKNDLDHGARNESNAVGVSPTPVPGPSGHATELPSSSVPGAAATYSGSKSTPTSGRDGGNIKGILKNKNEKSPIAPNALSYMEPSDLSIRDNNYEQERRFSKLVDSKELYARKVRAGLLKKGKYNQSRRNTVGGGTGTPPPAVHASSTSAENFSFRPKRQSDSSDSSDGDQGGKDYKPPFTA